MEQLIVKQNIGISTAKVFDAIKNGILFEETGLVEGSMKISFQVGGSYSFEWKSGGKCWGEFKNIEENKNVTFTWNTKEKKIESVSETTVSIKLDETPEGTLMTLTHEGLKSGKMFDSHKHGWETSTQGFLKNTL